MKSGKNNPNVIILVLDSLRADRLSCYGHFRETSPHIDKIRAEGILFKKCYSVTTFTFPAHVSMLTGLHTFQHGAGSNWSVIDKDIQTLSEVFRNNNYYTLWVNNNVVLQGKRGFARGFDNFIELWNVSRNKRHYKIRIKRMIDHYFGQESSAWRMAANLSKRLKWLKRDSYRFQGDKGGEQTIRIFKEKISTLAGNNTPFFFFANFLDTHIPHFPPERYKNLYLGNRKISRNLFRLMDNVFDWYEGRIHLDKEDWFALNALYDAKINYVDDLIGDLYSTLEAHDILDNTILVIASDHGEMLGEHNFINHGWNMFEGNIRIPLIIRFPQKLDKGSDDDNLLQISDLFHILCRLAGVESDIADRNTSDTSIMDDGLFRHRKFIVADEPPIQYTAQFKDYPNFLSKYNYGLRMILEDNYKYIWRTDGQHMLFNLRSDAGEKNNLYREESDMAKRLHDRMVDWYRQFDAEFDIKEYRMNVMRRVQDISEDENMEIEKQLKRLGYL